VLLEVLEETRHAGDHLELMRVDGAELAGLVDERLAASHDEGDGVGRLDDHVRDGHLELPDPTPGRRRFSGHGSHFRAHDDTAPLVERPDPPGVVESTIGLRTPDSGLRAPGSGLRATGSTPSQMQPEGQRGSVRDRRMGHGRPPAVTVRRRPDFIPRGYTGPLFRRGRGPLSSLDGAFTILITCNSSTR
jgi:hypothetical protein